MLSAGGAVFEELAGVIIVVFILGEEKFMGVGGCGEG